MRRWLGIAIVAVAVLGLAACLEQTGPGQPGKLPPAPHRDGDEIVIAGQYIHTGTPVVLWIDRGGYNAYTGEPRVVTPTAVPRPRSAIPTTRFAQRDPDNLRITAAERAQVTRDGWSLPLLRDAVDQFVIHYDETGVSRHCFAALCRRGLSVHFMLDLDGTIYQTLDVREKAWHATIANDRSVGVEIANVGAYTPGQDQPLASWYRRDPVGWRVVVPPALGDGGMRTAGFVARPAQENPAVGLVQGELLRQFDFTPEQYRALIHLTAALCTALPRVRCDYPHDGSGELINHKLPNRELADYQGLLGHYHIQTNKTDPGPAFQWATVVRGALALMPPQP